jgi:hypothetical protein
MEIQLAKINNQNFRRGLIDGLIMDIEMGFHPMKNRLLIASIFLLVWSILMLSIVSNLSIRINPKENHGDITLVTGFFDIDRKDRSNELYFQWIRKTLTVPVPLVIYTQKKFKNEFRNMIVKRKHPTMLIEMELNDLGYSQHYSQVKQILQDKTYQSLMENPGRIECKNPWYAILQFSKFEMVRSAMARNTFSTSKFGWIDIGLSKHVTTFGTFWNTTMIGDRLLLKSFNGLKNQTVMDVKRSSAALLAGGFFASTPNTLRMISDEMNKIWVNWLLLGIVNNEQVALLDLYQRNQTLFDTIVHTSHISWDFDEIINLFTNTL